MALGGPLAFIFLVIAWGIVWWLHPSISSVLSNHRSFQGAASSGIETVDARPGECLCRVGCRNSVVAPPGARDRFGKRGSSDRPVVSNVFTQQAGGTLSRRPALRSSSRPAARRGDVVVETRGAYQRWDVQVLFGDGFDVRRANQSSPVSQIFGVGASSPCPGLIRSGV